MKAETIDVLRLVLYGWAAVVAPVVAWLVAQWRRLGARHDALTRALSELRVRVEGEVARIEADSRSVRERLAQTPTAAGLANVEGDIKAMRASLDGMNRFMGRMDAVLSRQEEHLLRGGSLG